ncbi:hypothetical protein PoB_005187400 [Plakobranchus ocellatus]|uniref:Uncharacterized protein n=1 Tax=Plakobranchus ocellatus TaxID=259542 RepID=A0AAV4BYR2_9GAST|nr:hypothetical protein PoB_005187400 [Plakobranchus ocellatus]
MQVIKFLRSFGPVETSGPNAVYWLVARKVYSDVTHQGCDGLKKKISTNLSDIFEINAGLGTDDERSVQEAYSRMLDLFIRKTKARVLLKLTLASVSSLPMRPSPLFVVILLSLRTIKRALIPTAGLSWSHSEAGHNRHPGTDWLCPMLIAHTDFLKRSRKLSCRR